MALLMILCVVVCVLCTGRLGGLGAANQAGAFNQGGGGFDFGAALPGFGFGMDAAGAFSQFFQQRGQISRNNRNTAEAFEGTQAQLRSLLGIASGNVLTSPGNDFVGGIEDPRSRFLAMGTLVDGPSGGLNPLVFKARQNLMNLLKTQAVQPQDLQRLQGIGNEQVAGQLNASRGTSARSPNELLGQILNFGGAGQQSANIGMQAALANRAFGQQVAGQGQSFLNQLFSAAGATF